jgi:hypothetical protein
MTSRAGARHLRDELAAFAAGPERSVAQVKRIGDLAERIEEVPWRDELLFVVRHYSPRDEATGEQPLVALAELILDDWSRQKPEPRWRLVIPQDARGLQRRWLDAAGRERATAVAAALATGRLEELAFAEHQGRLDFRGYVEPELVRGRWVADLDRVDFSGATFQNLHFSNRTIRDCRFQGVDFHDLRFWSTTVLDTTFDDARFGDIPVLDGVLGRPARCTFRRVSFRGANLSYAMPKHALFEDCDFSGAKLYRAIFECDLIRCRFAGRLHDVTFWGRRWGPRPFRRGKWVLRKRLRLDDLDFSAADLHYVGFRGIDVSTLRLPTDPTLRIVRNWPCAHAFLKKRFAGTPDADIPLTVRFTLGHEPYGMAGNGATVLELNTFQEADTAGNVALLERLLDEAEAACG